MATREAGLRLRWDQTSFSSQVRASADTLKREFRGAGDAFGTAVKRSVGAGFGAARASLAGLAGQVKSVLGTALTLGGAVSLTEFARRAVDAEEHAGAVAAQLRRMGDAGAKTKDVLAFSVDEARRLSIVTADATATYAALLDETGDRVFSREAIASVAQFQHAFRLANGDASNLVGALKDGLNANVEQLRTDFAPALRDAISQGGMNAQQLAQMAPQIVKAMTTIGSQGGQGFVELVGLINMTEGALGGAEAALRPVSKLLLALRSSNLTKLGGQLGIKFDKDSSSAENLLKIMGAKGGVGALEKAFGKSSLTAAPFRALMLKFEEAQRTALAEDPNPERARKVAVMKFAAELERMTRTVSTASDVDADVTAKLEDKSTRFKLAIDRMSAAFTKPEILNSLDKIAAALPQVADGFARLVSFTAENPAAAGAAGIGAIALSAALEVAAAMFFKSLLGRVKSPAVGGAGGALGGLGGTMTVGVINTGSINTGLPTGPPVHTTYNPEPKIPIPGGEPTTPPAMKSFRLAPLGAAGAAGLGASLLVATASALGGAILGDIVRRKTIDPEQRRQMDKLTLGADEALGLASSASGEGATTARKQAAIKALRRAGKEVESTRGGVTDFLNNTAAAFGGAKAPEEMRREKLAALSEAEARLAAQVENRIALERRLARANEENARAIDQSTKATRGVNRPPAPLPGSARVGG